MHNLLVNPFWTRNLQVCVATVGGVKNMDRTSLDSLLDSLECESDSKDAERETRSQESDVYLNVYDMVRTRVFT